MSKTDDTRKLNIKVLYESLCPDSLRFIERQLYPAWPHIAEYVKIDFVPFGKAKSFKEGKHFMCQHGSNECAANRMQSCVLNKVRDAQKKMEFVHCFMVAVNRFSINTYDEEGRECVVQSGISWKEANDCYKSDEGKIFQLKAESVTQRYSPSFIPTVIYENNFDQTAQDQSIAHFKDYICSILKRSYPEACREYANF